MDATDRRLIEAVQSGLPLVARPYDAVAERLGLAGGDVRARLSRLVELGVVRRIGAIPNHYALGLTANGMSVWDVEDDEVGRLGIEVGGLDFVTHCYTRPRHPPLWPYNLFAMVHGGDRAEVLAKVEQIARLLGASSRRHDVLFSTRILKKTGLRLSPRKG